MNVEIARNSLSLQHFLEARAHLAGVIHRTPVMHSRSISTLVGGEVHFKCENLQRTGSFKIRGAYHKLCGNIGAESDVVAASAGNHAQGVALAATLCGKSAIVVMPENACRSKVKATLGYGARVILSGTSYQDAYRTARRISAEREAVFIHAFDDPEIIAGQGTVGFEILEALPDVETVVCPVGGGGLIAGIAYVIKALKPSVRVVGACAERAPALVASAAKGSPVEVPSKPTIADGIAVDCPGDLPFQLIRGYVDEVAAVGEEAMEEAIMLLLTRAKTLVEGAGVAGLAALMEGKVGLGKGRTCVVLSGGNIDPLALAGVASGRKNAGEGKEMGRGCRRFGE